MNYEKLDASLSAVVDNESLTDVPDLSVFVQTLAPPDYEQKEELKRLGVTDIGVGRTIFSAQISSQAVSELSDKPWVLLLSLSQDFRFLK